MRVRGLPAASFPREMLMSEMTVIGLRSVPVGATGCRSCGSGNKARFNAEFAVSFPKFRSALKNPPIYMVGTMVVCLGCGFSELSIPQTELRQLDEGAAA
jgi:hypothetical protein